MSSVAAQLGRPASVVVGLLLSSALAAGCSSSTVTLAEADRRASQLVREVPTIVGKDLVPLRPEYVTGRDCVSEPSLEPTGQEGVVRDVILGGTRIAETERAARDVQRHVEARGFALTSWEPREGDVRAIYSDADDFRLVVEVGRDDVSVTATSPCVWPDGEPP